MTEREREVIDICLETFMKKGLSETSVRDLSGALNLQSGGIYTYFSGKDQAVIACAEEAALRIEAHLITHALRDIEDPALLVSNLFERSKEMRPLMRFFTSVCALPKYEKEMRPALTRLSARYRDYTVKFAEKVGKTPKEVAPYVYITINTMLSYMLFAQESFSAPQMELMQEQLTQFLKERDALKDRKDHL